MLRWRDISINPGDPRSWRGKEPLEFTQREFDLLEVFMREPRRVFSKDHLLEIVWGHDFEGGPNIVETYISYLRAKIDRPGEPGFIHPHRSRRRVRPFAIGSLRGSSFDKLRRNSTHGAPDELRPFDKVRVTSGDGQAQDDKRVRRQQ